MSSFQRRSLISVILAIFLLFCHLLAFAATSAQKTILTATKNIIVWQRFGQWLMITEDQSDGRVCYYYDPVAKTKLLLKRAAAGTWIPLGSAIKWLMYVDYYQNEYRLMAHDVDWQVYYIAWPASQDQVGCAMVGNKCIFGQYRSAKIGDYYPVDLYSMDLQTGACSSFCISDSYKCQFAHDGDLLVYRSSSGSGTVGITGHYINSGDEFTIAQRDGIEPAVYGNIVAWAEADESGYDIIGKNIVTDELRIIAHTNADPPNPEVGKYENIFWCDSRNLATTGVDIYGYDWNTKHEYVVTNASGEQTKLRVCEDYVTWVTGAASSQTLWYATITEPVMITDLRADGITNDSVQLGWTSIGASSNPAVSYELRTRDDMPISDSNWPASTLVSGLSAPKASGQSESFNISSLSSGYHYFAIKAKLQNGDYSLLSNCIKVCISDSAFDADIGSYVVIDGTVSGVSSDCFYIQTGYYRRAIKVKAKSGQPTVIKNQQLTAVGVLSEDDSYYGPMLNDSVLANITTSSYIVAPLGMINSAVGGYDTHFGGIPGSGASNIWMLIKCWGKVSELSTSGVCSFYIDDGSLKDSKICVTYPFTPPTDLQNGAYICVNGICKVTKEFTRQIDVVDSNGINVISD